MKTKLKNITASLLFIFLFLSQFSYSQITCPDPYIWGDTTICDTIMVGNYGTTNTPGNTYSWTVTPGTILTGNGTTNITVQWATTGMGTICLTENNGGCDSTVCIQVPISTPPVPLSIATPPTSCAGDCPSLSLITPFDPTSSYWWSTTNGTIVGPNNGQNVIVCFTNAGPAQVNLSEWTLGGCYQTSNVSINVEESNVFLNITGPTTSCLNDTIQYNTPTSLLPATWSWSVTGGAVVFGQGSISPFITFNQPGNQTITLSAIDGTNGCSNTETFTVFVDSNCVQYPPISNFVTSGGLCAGNYMNFIDISTDQPQTWFWDFGDGNTSTLQNPWHSYGSQGSYAVTLTVSNGFGSDISTQVVTVNGFAPTNLSGPLTSCVNNIESYCYNNSPGVSYSIYTSGTVVSSTSNCMDIAWNNGGWNNLEVSAYDSLTGCWASDSIQIYVDPNCVLNPPVSYFTYTGGSCAGSGISFYDASTDQPQSWFWDFGDGSTSTQQNPWHYYANGGIYTVTLTVTNGLGSDTSTQGLILNTPPSPTMTGALTSCVNNLETYCFTSSPSVTFTMYTSGTVVNSTSNCMDILWNNVGLNFIDVTSYDSLTGCMTYDSIGIQVYNSCVLTSDFDWLNLNCSNTIHLSDQSSGAINSWLWDFGDGNVSTVSNPTHTYGSLGTYVVTLIVTDINGSDTSSQVVSVSSPPSINLTGPSSTCLDSSEVYCTSPVMAGYSYSWSTQNGNITNQSNGCIDVLWNNPGNGFVSLSIYDSLSGCWSNDSTNVFIDGNCVLLANFYGQNQSCVNSQVFFGDMSTGNITTWHWDMGDGSIYSNQYPTHTYLTAGTYTVELTVSNAIQSSSFSQIITISPPLQANLSGDTVVCSGSMESYCSASNPMYNYWWSIDGGSTNAGWFDSCATVSWGAPGSGMVYVQVSDSNSGCWASDTLMVSITTGPAVSIFGDTTVLENSTGNQYCAPNNPDETYLWTVSGGSIASGQGSNCITVDWGSGGTGTVGLEITNSTTGCYNMDSLYVNILFQNPNLLNGYLFEDLNNNCVMDPGETPLSNTFVEITPGPFYAITDANGYFEIVLGDGTWEVNEVLTGSNWNQICPPGNSNTVTFGGTGDTTTVFFGNEAVGECGTMSVDFSTWIGFDPCVSSIWYVYFCNEGNVDVQNAYVEITFDSFSTVTSSSIAWNQISGTNDYTFGIGTVPAGQCGTFYVYTFMDCAAPMGATLCEEITIYPNDPCTAPSTGWDKSSVMVSGSCTTDSSGTDSLACFDITNTGDPIDGDMDGPTEVRIFVNNILVYANTIQLLGGETQTICWPGGGTIRLEVDQRPGHPGNSNPNDVVENCGSGSGFPFIPGLVNTMSSNDYDNFHEIECYEVGQSYDPNDKSVIPLGITEDRYISPSDDLLEYKIRFQNTGTAAAINIIIRDTLSPFVNITTLDLGSRSHEYEIEIVDSNILEFHFNYIMLPDSTSDPEGSKGFIKFKIKTTPGLDPGTVIENRAAIYFDLNDPIITNYAWVTIMDTVLTSVYDPMDNSNILMQIKVWPNPASEFVNFQTKGIENESFEIRIVDMMGREVRTLNGFGDKSITMARESLSNGVYIFKLTSKSGLEASGKFIIKE